MKLIKNLSQIAWIHVFVEYEGYAFNVYVVHFVILMVILWIIAVHKIAQSH